MHKGVVDESLTISRILQSSIYTQKLRRENLFQVVLIFRLCVKEARLCTCWEGLNGGVVQIKDGL